MKILLKLDHFVSAREDYKPYMAQLSAENVYVEVEVPGEKLNDKVVIQPDSLALLMGSIADAIGKMHEEYILVKFQGGKK